MSRKDKESNGSKKLKSSRSIYKNLLSGLLCIIEVFRYYVDLLIDKLFGLYYDSKRVYLENNPNPLLFESATTLARKIRKGQLNSEDVVKAYIERAKQINTHINALVDTRFDEALNEARKIDLDIATGNILDVDFQEKPFLGVPFTSKESTAVKGMSYTFGIKKRQGKKAAVDADCIALMKKAGGICLGVTNIPQLNLWQETINPIYGRTNNPYNTTRNVGGSSGGESSLLAAGGSPIGIGTDIGGSCRIPAFMCGIFGHKPTSGLISTKGLTFRTGKESQTMVVVGPMTRYAEDIAPLLKVLVAENANKLKLDHPVSVKNLKIYYIINPEDPLVSPLRSEMKKILADAVNYLNEISETKPEAVRFKGLKYTGKLWRYWMERESDANFKLDINDRAGEVTPWIEIIKHFTIGGDYSLSTVFNFINSYFPKVKKEWAETETENLRTAILNILDERSVLLYPSAPWPASYHNTAFLRPYNFNLFSIWNVLKLPVTQIPMGLSKDGLPLGIQVVSAPYQDRLCIAVAKELEKQFGGYVPPIKICKN